MRAERKSETGHQNVGPDWQHFFQTLRFPSKPHTIHEADDALRVATEALSRGQARHVEAGKLLSKQQLGQVPEITQAEVDKLGAELAPLIDAEKVAQDAKRSARAAFNNAVAEELEEPLQSYAKAVDDHITALADLLAVGAVLRQDASAAGVTLPSKLPSLCPTLIGQLQTLRAIIARA